jgi:Tol biopolymer transport system component
MPSLGELLERESTTVDLDPGHFERMLRRRDRKHRNERIRAGALAILVLVVMVVGLARALNTDNRTAIDPTPTPVATERLGSLTYSVDGDIYVADWNGRNPIKIADGPPPRPSGPGCSPGYWAEGSIWSPDGRYLAYRHNYCQDAQELQEVTIFDPEGNLVASFPGEGWLISWSPDSTRLAVWVRFGETIGVYGLDGIRQTLLTLPPGLAAPGDFDPAWSSDGAALSVPYGVELPLDGRTPRQLPPDDPRAGVMSPDGARVAYNRGGSLVVAATDASRARELIRAGVGQFVWSPTGDRIAFPYPTSEGGWATELRVIDVTSGAVTHLAGGMGVTDSFKALAFSPDGERILFSTADRSFEVTALWTVNADGSGLRRLVLGTSEGDWQTIPTR